MSRTLSIDYGEKRIGLALSDALKIIAKPFKTLKNTGQESLIKDLKNIIEDNDIDTIVVGLPLTLKGNYSEQTDKVVTFVELIKNQLSVNIDTYDERLSSVEAKRSLIHQGIKTGHNKSEIDKTAAAIFLQSYLDKNANK